MQGAATGCWAWGGALLARARTAAPPAAPPARCLAGSPAPAVAPRPLGHRTERSHIPPSKLEAFSTRRAPRPRKRHRSVFGLPMVRAGERQAGRPARPSRCALPCPALHTAAAAAATASTGRRESSCGCRHAWRCHNAVPAMPVFPCASMCPTAAPAHTPLLHALCAACLCPARQIRPDSVRYVLWSSVVLFSDLTYSAFVVPIRWGQCGVRSARSAAGPRPEGWPAGRRRRWRPDPALPCPAAPLPASDCAAAASACGPLSTRPTGPPSATLCLVRGGAAGGAHPRPLRTHRIAAHAATTLHAPQPALADTPRPACRSGVLCGPVCVLPRGLHRDVQHPQAAGHERAPGGEALPALLWLHRRPLCLPRLAHAGARGLGAGSRISPAHLANAQRMDTGRRFVACSRMHASNALLCFLPCPS